MKIKLASVYVLKNYNKRKKIVFFLENQFKTFIESKDISVTNYNGSKIIRYVIFNI